MKFIFNYLWHGGALIFWVGCLIIAPFSLLFEGCGYDQYESFISPNKKYVAIVSIVNCGATTSFETQISVNRLDAPDDRDVLVVLDGHPEELEYKVSWLGESTIKVSEFNFKSLLSFRSRSTSGDIVKSLILPKSS
ncbi:hypothetical protein Q4489_10180 [Thalassotalea sp. 1_MG-2023]|uniref:hypothetical protein n=1 Tax=Thalassotalea sp. 1_MG-2023 TaxID=3062680 RepID=UPI0026E320DC|nr:hypothetical protein [Thalassotalea sp. 1_MG-2023]MDO6427383.1 hypothetical protein [Thalassotalea sp. 1_MG-2023]